MATVMTFVACETGDDFDADIGIEKATSEHIGWVITRNFSMWPNVSKIRSGAGKAIAMIVYVGEPGSVDASSSDYRCLAIALTDATASNGEWGRISTSTQGKYYNTWADGSETDAAKDMNGINNTKELSMKEASASIRAYTYKNGSPGMNWFLPSAGQWYKVLNGTCGLTWKDWGNCTQGSEGYDKINNMFKAAGASEAMLSENTFYWTSTEYSDEEAVYIRFSSSYGPDVWHTNKETTRVRGGSNGWISTRVRPFYAFK